VDPCNEKLGEVVQEIVEQVADTACDLAARISATECTTVSPKRPFDIVPYRPISHGLRNHRKGIGSVGGKVAAEAGSDVAATTARLQGHVGQAVADYESGAISMSARQARAVGRNPGLEQAFRGQVIDSAVKNAVRNDSELSHLWVSRSGEFGPDFHDIGTGTWWDVTTPGKWLNHVDSYTDPFGVGIGLFTR
jgi:hypothetical protein